MKALQRVVWSDGMLMAPQHFQQQDLYHETLLDERLLYSLPYAWGAYQLTMDVESLARGQVAVRTFRGVLPKGTVLSFGGGEHEAPPARALEPYFPAHTKSIDVFLALTLERQGVGSYASGSAPSATSVRTRHVVETRRVLDVGAAAEEVTVEFARRNVQLLLGEEANEDYELIKIAEVTRERGGQIFYSPSYVPPCLRVSASEFLVAGVRKLLAASVAKRRAVAEERRHRDASAVEFAADEVSRYLAVHSLSKAIPWLKHLVDDGQLSPSETYRMLIGFAGELSTFSVDEDPALLPTYSHGDLRSTFEPLFAKLMSLLQLSVASKVVTIPLESRHDGMHLGRLADPELHKQGVRYVLAVQAQADEHKVYELVPRVAKVASWSEIPRYVSAALSGLALTPAARPPREIPVRPGKCYFLMSTDHAIWRGITQERAVAVHLPPPFDPKHTTLELLAIPPA